AGYKNNVKIKNIWVDTKDLNEENVLVKLKDADGIIVPGGFGAEATNGKMLAIKYARENKVPMLGICYGMQLTLIEYARNVLNISDANSTEIDKHTKNPIYIESEKSYLGSKEIKINKDSKLSKIYNSNNINERFRNNYRFNLKYQELFEQDNNLILTSYHNDLLAAVELKDHPWFISVQYHPEYLSRPLKPHPLFSSFVRSTIIEK
ncbi:MAG TPA: C26 family cysteine hydrolase domain-containing family, partial [Acholeplasma sp.]|nr:C26 family cysteine hydrolase domain-containing family [Acholeplasma sp.]